MTQDKRLEELREALSFAPNTSSADDYYTFAIAYGKSVRGVLLKAAQDYAAILEQEKLDENDCRREFEKWYSNSNPECRSIEKSGSNYKLMQAQQSFLAWEKAWNTRQIGKAVRDE